MEWFLLIVVLPLILVPIVLLGGFAGCGTVLGIDSPDPEPTPAPPPPPAVPATPNALTATPVSDTQINLTWFDNTGGTAKFIVSRQKMTPGEIKAELPGFKDKSPYEDKGLAPATLYTYWVAAVFPPTGTKSGESAPASATTFPVPSFQPAYDQPLTTDDADLKGRTLVQTLTANTLTANGEQLRVTLRGRTNAGLAIDHLFVSELAGPEPGNLTPDPYDSPSAGLRELRVGGVYIPAGKPITIDPINFHVDKSKGHLFAFDMNATLGLTKKANVPGQTAYHRAPADEAAVSDRSATGYTPVTGVYVVEKIELFPNPAPAPPAVTWKPCVSTTFNADSITLGNATVVQRIGAALLTNGGNPVRLTIRTGTTGLVIRRMFISAAAEAGEPGNPTPQLWDSAAATIKEIRPGGASIPPSTTILLQFDYVLDKTKDLLIAFDIAEIPGTICRQRNIAGPSYFYRGNTEEAAASNRSAGYTQVTDQICIVEKIETV